MADPVSSDIFEPSSPYHRLLGMLADKWTVLVLIYLGLGGSERFGRLQKELGGVSTRTLTRTLRNLERSGLVTRKVTPTVPVTVEYRLSVHGVKLARIFGPLPRFFENNLEAFLRAEKLYDSAKHSERAKSSGQPSGGARRRRGRKGVE